mmetsp:Transcript_63090/g.150383  ORF Transcript_63090/g.150383 Transcript_63090/m.150383 type:complete len:824 (+) Transcript_63090:138-2609(+)
MAVRTPPKYTVGAHVEYYSKSYDEWIPAIVNAIRPDGALRLLHDDGSVLKEQADPSQCRLAQGASSGKVAAAAPKAGNDMIARSPSLPRNNRAPSPSAKQPGVPPLGGGATPSSKAAGPVAVGAGAGTPRQRALNAQPPGGRNSPPLPRAASGAPPAKASSEAEAQASLNGTINPKKFYVGDKVRIKESGREGLVMYFGIPSFSNKEIIGMKLDEKRSKSDCDGKAPNGERLFRCPAGFGIFLPSEDVEKVAQEEPDSFPAVQAPEVALDLNTAFNGLVGHSNPKQTLTKVKQLVEVQKKREGHGVLGGKTLHFVFRGNRGSGMTTVAKLMAHLLRDMEVITSGQLIEVDRKGLIGSASDVEKEMSKVWKAATGGVLMVNDVHLFHDRERSRDSEGIEASDFLAKQLDAMAKKCSGEGATPVWPQAVCLVLACPNDAQLPEPLKIPGFLTVDFPDFTHEELTRILVQLVEKRKFGLAPGLSLEKLQPHVRDAAGRAEVSGEKNIVMLQRMLDDAIGRQTERAWAAETVSLHGLTTLVEEDFVDSLSPSRDANIKAALARLDNVVGLQGVKNFVLSLYAQLKTEVERREAGIQPSGGGVGTLHMIFSGNPGTGKTTVARIVAELLTAMGLMRKGHMIEADRGALVAGYSGQTALKTKQVIESAMGGVLFIDEAYALVSEDGKDGFGKEALDTLIKMIEDRRQDLVVILAGYPDEMGRLVSANPGVKSRFPTQVLFEDYSHEELLQIADKMLLDDVLMLSQSASNALSKLLQKVAGSHGRENGNGRAVRNILEMAKRKMAVRLQAGNAKQRSKDELCTLEAADFE